MKWTANNRACLTTWSVLMGLNQISERRSFKTTGSLKMSALPFFPQGASDAVAKERTKAFALMLDKIFRRVRFAELESGKTSAKAVEAMCKILADKDKLVEDLADVADDYYLFLGERELA